MILSQVSQKRLFGSVAKMEGVLSLAAETPLAENSPLGSGRNNRTLTLGFAALKSQKTQQCSWQASGETASGPTVYLYDGHNLIQELDATGNVIARYTHNPGIDRPLAEVRAGATSYYEQDGQGSVSSLSNSAGALANTYVYDTYGKLTTTTGTITNPFRYTGRELDSETGLYFNRARYYDPAKGRWLSEDPIQFFGGVDFYAYVQNNPLKYRDPLGLQGEVPDCYPDCVHTQDERARMQHDHDERMRGIDIPDADSNNPPSPPKPPATPCSCNNYMYVKFKEIDERSWRAVKHSLWFSSATQAAEHLGPERLKHFLPWGEWGDFFYLEYELWEIQEEVSAKYKHCEP